LAGILAGLVGADHVIGDLSWVVPRALLGGENWEVNFSQLVGNRSTLAGSSPSTGANGGSTEFLIGKSEWKADRGNRSAEGHGTANLEERDIIIHSIVIVALMINMLSNFNLLALSFLASGSVMITDHGIQFVAILKRHDSLGAMSSSHNPVIGNDGTTAEEGVSIGPQVASPGELIDSGYLSSNNSCISLATLAIAWWWSLSGGGGSSTSRITRYGNLALEPIRLSVATWIAVVALENNGQAVGRRRPGLQSSHSTVFLTRGRIPVKSESEGVV